MPAILCIHGIGQQLKGKEIIANEWRTALRDGMRISGAAEDVLPRDEDIAITFYGDLFRKENAKGSDSPFQLADIDEELEEALVKAWYLEAGTAFAPKTVDREAVSKSGWQTETVQQMAVALLKYPYFAALTERIFVGALKQVRTYFADPQMRQAVRRRFAGQLTSDTRLVIAHSLGTIVAYETLCETKLFTPAFITLGSPLGLPNLIFDRLDPVPVGGKGNWPGGVRSWTNIADRHDIVAAVKDLGPLFDGVRDVRVANEALAHDVGPYLTAKETGASALEALRG